MDHSSDTLNMLRPFLDSDIDSHIYDDEDAVDAWLDTGDYRQNVESIENRETVESCINEEDEDFYRRIRATRMAIVDMKNRNRSSCYNYRSERNPFREELDRILGESKDVGEDPDVRDQCLLAKADRLYRRERNMRELFMKDSDRTSGELNVDVDEENKARHRRLRAEMVRSARRERLREKTDLFSSESGVDLDEDPEARDRRLLARMVRSMISNRDFSSSPRPSNIPVPADEEEDSLKLYDVEQSNHSSSERDIDEEDDDDDFFDQLVFEKDRNSSRSAEGSPSREESDRILDESNADTDVDEESVARDRRLLAEVFRPYRSERNSDCIWTDSDVDEDLVSMVAAGGTSCESTEEHNHDSSCSSGSGVIQAGYTMPCDKEDEEDPLKSLRRERDLTPLYPPRCFRRPVEQWDWVETSSDEEDMDIELYSLSSDEDDMDIEVYELSSDEEDEEGFFDDEGCIGFRYDEEDYNVPSSSPFWGVQHRGNTSSRTMPSFCRPLIANLVCN